MTSAMAKIVGATDLLKIFTFDKNLSLISGFAPAVIYYALMNLIVSFLQPVITIAAIQAAKNIFLHILLD